MDEAANKRNNDIIGCSLAIIALVIIFNDVTPISTIKYSAWAFSEWLINYEGGFVRRGLFGQLLLVFKDQVKASNIIVLIIDCIFLFLGSFYLFKLKGPNKVAFMATFFLGTFGIINHLINNQYYYRKEYLGFVIVLFIVLLKDKISNNFISVVTLLSFVFILIAILDHESFVFAHFGLLIFLFWNAKASAFQKVSAICLILIPFIVVSLFHGQKDTSDLIWHSISEGNKTVINSSQNAIQAISWDFHKSVELSIYIFTHIGQLTYWFTALIIFLTQLFIIFFYLRLDVKHLIFFLLLNVGLIPLFLLGWDWGRWFNIMIFNLSIVILKMEDYKSFVKATSEKVNKIVYLQFLTKKLRFKFNFQAIELNSNFLIIFFLLIIFFNVPECCIQIFKDFVTVLFK